MFPDSSRAHTSGAVIPIRAFALGKARLAASLDGPERAALGRRWADQVVQAAAPMPVVVVSSDPEVRAWAADLGIEVLDDPGTLDGAASLGRDHLRDRGCSRVVVAHADLPRARDLARLTRDRSQPIVALVPCHRDDGTPVLSVPTAYDFRFAYGPDSFRRHAVEARRLGLGVRVVRDHDLGFDVDLPDDLLALDRDPRTIARTVVNVLAIGAHPDDIEFGCGATLARWARAGAHVELLVLTDGSKGTWDAGDDLATLVATRREEQRAAARTLGAADVHFLDAVDGELEADARRREEVCAVIRRSRPDVVLGHDPWKQYRLHPDHRHAGQLVIDGIVAARDPHYFPDAGTPHRPERLLLFEAQVVDHLEPVEPVDITAKIEALLCHKSQWRSTMGIEEGSAEADAQRAAFEERIRTAITEAGGEEFKELTDL